MQRNLAEITKVVKAHSKYKVLRSSLPAGVRAALELDEGDQLQWSIISKGNKIVVEVRKVVTTTPLAREGKGEEGGKEEGEKKA